MKTNTNTKVEAFTGSTTEGLVAFRKAAARVWPETTSSFEDSYDGNNKKRIRGHKKPLSVDDYLKGQQQQQAIKELPRWMPQVEADIAQLRHRYDNLVSVMAILIAITLSALVLLMGSLIIIN